MQDLQDIERGSLSISLDAIGGESLAGSGLPRTIDPETTTAKGSNSLNTYSDAARRASS